MLQPDANSTKQRINLWSFRYFCIISKIGPKRP